MKTFSLLTALSLVCTVAIAQTKTITTTKTISKTTKPDAGKTNAGGLTSSKVKPKNNPAPSKLEKKKDNDMRECRMDARMDSVFMKDTYYQCPKCHYDSCKKGYCPRDGKYMQEKYGVVPGDCKCNN